MNTNQNLFPRSQRGAALIVSLIMLLVLTILGVNSMKTAILEEKMSGNLRDFNLAFQASESVLRYGEQEVRTALDRDSAFVANCVGGLCLPSTTDTPVWEDPVKVVWDTRTNTRSFGHLDGSTGPWGGNTEPSYIVERLPPPALPQRGDSLTQGGGYGPRNNDQYFRITAWSRGGTASSVAKLQSTYRK